MLGARMRMAASGLIVPGGGGVSAHSDTFTDSNGTLITSHAPDIGNGYSVFLGASGSMEIQSNEVRVGETVGAKSFIADIGGVSGYEIDAQFRMESSTHVHGFIFGAKPGDTSNFYYAIFITTSPNQIRIGREGHGGSGTLASANKTLSINTNYNANVTITAGNITFTYDGTSCNVSWTPPDSSYSYFGIYGASAPPSFTYVDNLIVTPS